VVWYILFDGVTRRAEIKVSCLFHGGRYMWFYVVANARVCNGLRYYLMN
jgi:hypothetical protein